MENAALFTLTWWTQSLGTWMAWTPATIVFCLFIFLCILSMAVWEYFRPGGDARVGVLRLHTTRGDRLFISLLGSSYIFMLWMLFVGGLLFIPLLICFVWFVLVFRFF